MAAELRTVAGVSGGDDPEEPGDFQRLWVVLDESGRLERLLRRPLEPIRRQPQIRQRAWDANVGEQRGYGLDCSASQRVLVGLWRAGTEQARDRRQLRPASRTIVLP